jgi:uncharacterized protein YcnI
VRRALAVAALGLGLLAPAAAAHVQVTPAEVAPGDAAVFTVLVPNERDLPTTKVAVKIPEGVIPFSFEETPGWERTEQQAANGALESVTWTGSLPEGSFVRFAFLASVPEAEGTLTFPAVQTYEDGQEAAWIGAPDAEEPAPTVEVTSAAATANAGGENGGDDGGGGPTTAEEPATTAGEAPGTSAPAETTAPEPTLAPTDAAVTEAAPVDAADDDGTPAVAWIAVVLGGAGLVAALAALSVASRKRGPSDDGDRPSGPEAF